MIDDEPVEALNGADARTIVDALWSNWPIVATLRPADIGMAKSTQREIAFIKTLQALSDAGLVSYEALVVGAGGPLVIDAALTARGRALLSARMHAPPMIRQLAS